MPAGRQVRAEDASELNPHQLLPDKVFLPLPSGAGRFQMGLLGSNFVGSSDSPRSVLLVLCESFPLCTMNAKLVSIALVLVKVSCCCSLLVGRMCFPFTVINQQHGRTPGGPEEIISLDILMMQTKESYFKLLEKCWSVS